MFYYINLKVVNIVERIKLKIEFFAVWMKGNHFIHGLPILKVCSEKETGNCEQEPYLLIFKA